MDLSLGRSKSQLMAKYAIAVPRTRYLLFVRSDRTLYKGAQQLYPDAQTAQHQSWLCTNVCGGRRGTTPSTTDAAILQVVPSAGTEHALRVNFVRMSREPGHMRTRCQLCGKCSSLCRSPSPTEQQGSAGRTRCSEFVMLSRVR